MANNIFLTRKRVRLVDVNGYLFCCSRCFLTWFRTLCYLFFLNVSAKLCHFFFRQVRFKISFRHVCKFLISYVIERFIQLLSNIWILPYAYTPNEKKYINGRWKYTLKKTRYMIFSLRFIITPPTHVIFVINKYTEQ